MQTRQWYVTNYPDGPSKVLGFLDYHVLFALQFDHIYASNYFLGMGVLLAASLAACSRSQQFPLAKMARRWKFPKKPSNVFAKGYGAVLRCTAGYRLCLCQSLLLCKLIAIVMPVVVSASSAT